MLFKITAVLALPLFVLSAPLTARQQLVPDLPAQADLVIAETKVRQIAYDATFRHANDNDLGYYIRHRVPIDETLDSVIGADQVLAIDILADRLCIAGKNQGSLCAELIAYAYSFIVIQEKGKTWAELTKIIGKSNMNQLKDDIHVLCVGDEQPNDVNQETCQVLLEDVDVLANSMIGTAASLCSVTFVTRLTKQDISEDTGNTNSLEYFGLADLLPKPQTITK